MVHTVHFENRSELNDTRCGRLATNGLSSANSNPSSTIFQDHPKGWFFFYLRKKLGALSTVDLHKPIFAGLKKFCDGKRKERMGNYAQKQRG